MHPLPVPGDHVGGWRLDRLLGEGGMAFVYEATHVERAEPAALKLPRRAERFLCGTVSFEADVLESARHPGVIQLIDRGVEAGVPWYTMPLLPGRSLRDRLVSEGAGETLEWVDRPAEGAGVEPRPPPTLPVGRGGLEIIARLCQTLAWLHGRGLVHRDLKPENILLDADGMPVLIDFGIVGRFADALGRDHLDVDRGRRAGTPAYMSPEQRRGVYADARSDLYAVGCLLYEWFTGDVPTRDAAAIRGLAAQGLPVSTALDHLVSRLLAPAPEDRPPYAAEVAEALAAAGGVTLSERLAVPVAPYLLRSRLVGRVEQVEACERRVGTFARGLGGLLCIEGPAGAGKTRIAAEVVGRTRASTVLTIATPCAPRGPAGARQTAVQALRAELDRALGEAGPDAPAAEAAPAAETAPAAERTIAPDARDRLLHSVFETLLRAGGRRPILWLIDDLQWADELTFELLFRLARLPPVENPVLVLATVRRGAETPDTVKLLGEPTVVRIAVEALGAEECVLLARGILGQPPPESLVPALVRCSGGVPFYVGEFLQLVLARGALRRESGVWVAEAVEGLPGDPSALLSARLGDLDAPTRRLLAAGALLGGAWRPVDAAALAELASGALQATVDLLVLRQMLQVRVAPAEEDVSLWVGFAHPRIEEEARGCVPEAERRVWHSRLADSLTGPSPERVGHLRAAGRGGEATTLLVGASEVAFRRGALRQARTLAEEAVAAGVGDPVQLIRLVAQSGQLLGDIADAERATLDGLRRTGMALPTGSLRWFMAWEAFCVLIGRTRRLSTAEADESMALIRVLAFVGAVHNRSEYFLLAALSGARLAPDASPAMAAPAWAGLGQLLDFAHLPSRATRLYHRARRLLRTVEEPEPHAFAGLSEGAAHLIAGRLTDAIDCLQEAERYALATRGGTNHLEPIRYLACSASARRGEMARARAFAEACLKTAVVEGHAVHASTALANLASVLTDTGDHVSAETRAREAATFVEGPEAYSPRLCGLSVLAISLWRQDRREEALAVADEVYEAITGPGAGGLFIMPAHEYLPELYMAAWAQGNPAAREKAVVTVAKASAFTRTATFLSPRVALHRAELARLQGNRRRCLRALRQAQAIAAAMQMPCEEGLAAGTRAVLLSAEVPERRTLQALARERLRQCEAQWRLAELERAWGG